MLMLLKALIMLIIAALGAAVYAPVAVFLLVIIFMMHPLMSAMPWIGYIFIDEASKLANFC